MRQWCLACFLLWQGLVTGGCGNGGEEAEPFAVLQTSPENHEVGVHREAVLAVQFNAEIDTSSLNASTFKLRVTDGAEIDGTVSAGATPDVALFTPNEPLDVLTGYTATITTGLVDRDARLLEEAYSWDFETLDSEWGRSQLLEDVEIGPGEFPQVATDPQSNAFAVWQQNFGDFSGIWASRFTRRELWGTAERIDSTDAVESLSPQLGVDAQGVAHVVWWQTDGESSHIFSNRYSPGQGWGTPEMIQTGEVTEARTPALAVAASGEAVAVWVQRDIEKRGSVVWANLYTPGQGWGNARLIGQAQPGFIGLELDAAIDDGGNAIAVWTRDGTQGQAVWASYYSSDAGWGAPVAVGPGEDLFDAPKPRVAMDAEGNAHVLWQQFADGSQDIWWNLYTAGRGWGEASLLEDDEHRAGDPAIAVGPSGIAHAVWWQSDGSLQNVWASLYTPGQGWSAPELIESPIEDPKDEGSAISPQVAVDPAGNAFAIWQQEDLFRFNIWSNRFVPGRGWGTAELLEQEEFFSTAPQIAVDANRHAHAVWAQADPTQFSTDIATNRFE